MNNYDEDLPELEEIYTEVNDSNISLHTIEFNSSINFDQIKDLIEMKADINEKKDDYTPLQLLCSNIELDEEILNYLIESKADVNSDNSDNSPLHRLCKMNNSFNLIKILVENNANVNSYGKYKYTPLYKLCTNTIIDYEIKKEIFDYLLENGSDIHIKDKWGWNLMIAALSVDDYKFFKYLVDKKIDINSLDNRGNNCLQTFFLIYIDIDIDLLEYFIENKSDLNHKNDYNFTILGLVKDPDFKYCYKSKNDIINLLIENKATI